MVYRKSFIKLIGILLLIAGFSKVQHCMKSVQIRSYFWSVFGHFSRSVGQNVIQIIRKNKSILMFLINPSNCFTGTHLKPSQHLRLRSVWYYWLATFSHQLMLQRLGLKCRGSLRSASGAL